MRRGQTLVAVQCTTAIYTNPGTLRDADSTPTAVVRKNGSASGIVETPSVADIGVGRYTVTFLFDHADWADGDDYCIELTWTMEGVGDYVAIVAQGTVELDPFLSGAVDDATPSTTAFDAATGLATDDDEYNGSFVAFTSGLNAGLARVVTDYTGATRTFQFTDAWPQAPADEDTFIIIGRQ